MAKDAMDFLTETLDEVKTELRNLRSTMQAEHKALSEKVVQLSERVLQLEHEEKVTRWFFAGGGAVIAIVVRELIPKLLH